MKTQSNPPNPENIGQRQSRQHEIILFITDWGRYKVTRKERFLLARLHGHSVFEAFDLAFIPHSFGGNLGDGFSSQYLFDRYTSNGQWRYPSQPCKTENRPEILTAGDGNG